MGPDWSKNFTTEIDKDVFDMLEQNYVKCHMKLHNFEIHDDVTAQPGLKPRRDL